MGNAPQRLDRSRFPKPGGEVQGNFARHNTFQDTAYDTPNEIALPACLHLAAGWQKSAEEKKSGQPKAESRVFSSSASLIPNP